MTATASTESRDRSAGSHAPPKPRVRVLSLPDGSVMPLPDDLLCPGATVDFGREATERGVRLPDMRASRRHARLEVDADGMGVRVLDTSSNGTFVNGERVKSAQLAEGDLLRMGDTFLLFRYLPADDPDVEVEGLGGEAPAMRALRRDVARAASGDEAFLIFGESGTGQEVVAQALHVLSGRAGSFVSLDCAALPKALADGQVFGHGRPGRVEGERAHPGRFHDARGGTLFFDDISRLPLPVQSKLAAALGAGAAPPAGGTDPVPIEARVLASTHYEPAMAVEVGQLALELHARFSSGRILRIPPLRQRREDILPLVRAHLGTPPPLLDPDLVGALLLYDWPHNVREALAVARELRVRGAGARRLELHLVRERLRIDARAREARSTMRDGRNRREMPTVEISRRSGDDD